MSFGDDHDPDDMFAHTKMSFWDHIEELRSHMWRAIIGFLVGLCIGLVVGKPMVGFIASPVERELQKFYDDRLVKSRQELKDKDPTMVKLNEPKIVPLSFDREQLATSGHGIGNQGGGSAGEDGPVELMASIRPVEVATAIGSAQRQVGRRPALATLSATEAFIVYFKVSIYCGIVIASPWIFYQMWSFVAAGLYTHEKKLVNVYLPVSLALFLAGVALAEFVVIPKALEYLLSFNEWMDLEPDLRLNEWLSFAILMPLVFGAAFQLPLVMLVLYRPGHHGRGHLPQASPHRHVLNGDPGGHPLGLAGRLQHDVPDDPPLDPLRVRHRDLQMVATAGNGAGGARIGREHRSVDRPNRSSRLLARCASEGSHRTSLGARLNDSYPRWFPPPSLSDGAAPKPQDRTAQRCPRGYFGLRFPRLNLGLR